MKISKDVLAVLSNVRVEGSRVLIGQPGDPPLDRKLYVKLDEVLNALGGKWNKKLKAHLFSEDAEALIESTLAAGEVTTATEQGYFATPDKLADQLVAMAGVKPSHHCLEPSAGEGSIVKAMMRAGVARNNIMAIELNEKRHASLIALGTGLWCGDFVKLSTRQTYDRIVANPPFGIAVMRTTGSDFDAHVRRMWDLLDDDGVLVSVAPSGLMYRKDPKHAGLRHWIERLDGTIDELPDGSFKSSGTTAASCVIRMER